MPPKAKFTKENLVMCRLKNRRGVGDKSYEQFENERTA